MAAINRTETSAAIDRAMDALKAMKNQLKAKKLNGSSINSLLTVAKDELRSIEEPIYQLYHADIDTLVTKYSMALGGEA